MAQRDYKGLLGKLLIGFLVEEDPLKAMLEWLAEELMRVEAEARVGAEKGKHSEERKYTDPLRRWTLSGGRVYTLFRR